MFDSILNAIAERSQALKDKDAEIVVWQETATEQEYRINGLVEAANGEPVRNQELRDRAERAEAFEMAAMSRAETAEFQLRGIAEALGIDVDVLVTPETVAVLGAVNAAPEVHAEGPPVEEAPEPPEPSFAAA